MLTILLIAISLSFDSFAVSASVGLKNRQHFLKTALFVCAVFAFFQGLMPFIGYLIGIGLKPLIQSVDHWLAFMLLTGVGVRFITESFEKSEDIEIKNLHWKVICLLGIATSIDALVVGVTFAFMDINILLSIMVISTVTFVISFLGYEAGKRLHFLKSQRLEILGGVVLIGIGLKILLTHLLG